MKKCIGLLCLPLLCFGLLCACRPAGDMGKSDLPHEEAAPTEGLWYFPNKEGDGYILYGIGSATDSDIVVAASYEGLPVTEIYTCAFMQNNDITSITIPASVRHIGDGAFYECQSLQSVTFLENSSLSSLGEAAFQSCPRLERVDFGANSKLTQIPAYAFYESGLKSVCLPPSVMDIGEKAFSRCADLLSVAFGADSQLRSVGERAFWFCTNLISITLPANMRAVGDAAFFGCEKLVEVCDLSSLNIRAGSTDHGCVGYNARNVYTATAGESKLRITDDGFVFYQDGDRAYLMGCQGGASSLILPADCDGAGYEVYMCAFFRRDELTEITIPAGVTGFGYQAFGYCSGLTRICYQGTREEWNAITKEVLWNHEMGCSVISCSDGYVSK